MMFPLVNLVVQAIKDGDCTLVKVEAEDIKLAGVCEIWFNQQAGDG